MFGSDSPASTRHPKPAEQSQSSPKAFPQLEAPKKKEDTKNKKE